MAVTIPRRERSDAVPLKAWRVSGRPAAIAGLGTYVPERVVTNDDIRELGVDTSDKWIRERTGIRSRHIADPGTTTFSLAAEAGRRALSAAGATAADLDLIVVATGTPDGPFPTVACRVQDELGVPGAFAFDLLAACTSFVYALSVAEAHIASGRAETALVIGAEVMSRMIDWRDRATCVLFGDGAGAAVLRPAERGAGFRSWCLGADGRGYDRVTVGDIEKGAYAAGQATPFISQKGPEVFKFATDILVRQAYSVTEAAGLSVDDIDLMVPHQANGRIIEAAARRLGLPMDKVALNVDRYGNTSSASIPLALGEALAQGRVQAGDRVLMVGFGSGLTWGATLMEWER